MTAISPVFIGLDLAWSVRNRTGGAVIRDGALQAWTGTLTDDASIETFIADHVPAGVPLVVAIDAPLRVPNSSGRRRADHEVSVAWGKFEAGAYPGQPHLAGVRRHDTRRGIGQRLVNSRFGCIETRPSRSEAPAAICARSSRTPRMSPSSTCRAR